MASARQRWRRQPQAPIALDQNHPFMRSPELCVNLNAGLADSCRGQIGTINNPASVSLVYGLPGGGALFTGSTTNAYLWSGRSVGPFTKTTFAAVFDWRSGGANSSPQLMGFAHRTNNQGVGLVSGLSGGGDLLIVKAGVVALSALTLTSGAPYFAIASHDEASGDYYITARRLDTNERSSVSGNNTQASSASDGTMAVGGLRADGNFGWNGAVYFAYAARAFLPRVFAESWLYNPWQILRPQQRRFSVNTAAASGFKAAWAVQNNSVVGVGVH